MTTKRYTTQQRYELLIDNLDFLSRHSTTEKQRRVYISMIKNLSEDLRDRNKKLEDTIRIYEDEIKRRSLE